MRGAKENCVRRIGRLLDKLELSGFQEWNVPARQRVPHSFLERRIGNKYMPDAFNGYKRIG